MEEQVTLFKGEQMEERLRNYFLSMGYYVVRGAKYKYRTDHITDIDLFLYGRNTIISRERINVDIKNKKSPQAFERILLVNGLKVLLGFDGCIVATTDKRPIINSFGQKHSTKILDGNFISKLQTVPADRLSEEELMYDLSYITSYKEFGNKDWAYLYDDSKSKLLTELDFSGFNANLIYLKYYLDKALTDEHKRKIATRMVYITISHLLLTMDFIIKDIAFFEQDKKMQVLSDGLAFGNLGIKGVDLVFKLASQIAGTRKNPTEFIAGLHNEQNEILKEHFSKNDTVKTLFQHAKIFEMLAYQRNFSTPASLEPIVKSTISVFLDCLKKDRKLFFESYN